MVPALHGFGWTGSNWAEIGHSMMKRHTKVWLSVAAVEDIADFIVQENNYLSFVLSTGKTIGKGPTSYAKKMKECREQRRYIESACDTLLTTDMQGVDKHTHPDSQFVPSCAAKHRVQKNSQQRIQRRSTRTKGYILRNILYQKKCHWMRKMKMKLISAHNQTTMTIITPILLETVTSDEPDDIVPPAPEPDIPQRRVMPARKRRGKNRKYMSTTAAESSSEEEI